MSLLKANSAFPASVFGAALPRSGSALGAALSSGVLLLAVQRLTTGGMLNPLQSANCAHLGAQRRQCVSRDIMAIAHVE